MNRAMFVISVLVLALSWSVVPCVATTYYIDATGGSDKNEGTSEEAAWQTLKNVDSVLTEGNTICFKRGETLRLAVTDWTSRGFWEVTGKIGTGSDPIVITGYGDQTDLLPILTSLELWDSGWLEDDQNPGVWAHTGVSNGAYRCFIDGVGQSMASALSAVCSDSIWYCDNSLDILYLFSQSDPAGSVVETLPETGYVLQLKHCENVVVEDIGLYGGRYGTLRLTGSEDEIAIRDCVVRYPGQTGIMGWDPAESLTNILIEGNEVDYMLSPDEIRVYECVVNGETVTCYFPKTNVSDGIAVDRDASHVIIRGNLVKDFSHTGIHVHGRRSQRGGVHDVLVESNEITAPNALHAHGWGLVGVNGKCSNNVVRWNYVHDVTTGSHCDGNNNKYYGNIIVNVRNHPEYPEYDDHSRGLDLNTWRDTIEDEPGYPIDETMVCYANSLFNNTIVGAEDAGIWISHSCSWTESGCDDSLDDVRDNFIVNNIIAGCGTAGVEHQIEISDPTGTNDPGDKLDVLDNYFYNNCFYVGAGSGIPIMYKGTEYSAAGIDAATLDDDFANSLDSNPKFIDEANDDYELFRNSPCKWTGDPIAVGYDDFNGDAFRNPPSRGAFEVEKGRGDADGSEGAEAPVLALSSRPNPFGPEASLHFMLPQAGSVRVTVHDPAGRLVAVLTDGHREAGEHRVTWDGKDGTGHQAATGVYFARLSAQNRSVGSKMILIR